MHRTLISAFIVLSTTLAACGQVSEVSSSHDTSETVTGAVKGNAPTDLMTGKELTEAEWEQALRTPNNSVYTVASKRDGLSPQATTYSCTILNQVSANQVDPYTNKYRSTVDFSILARCTATYSLLFISATKSNSTTGASISTTGQSQNRSSTNLGFGTLARYSGNYYGLSSSASVTFFDGSSGAATGPSATGYAYPGNP
jgi:hypothetical protein